MKKLWFFFFAFFSVFAFSQEQKILKIKNFEIATLPNSIDESSGLDFFNEKLFTFNDSGNTSELFEIDKNSGEILQILKTNLINKDWEALANDDKNFYIGDFGNNLGNRKDLKIYKIPFENNGLRIDSVKTISFYYPEQKDFKAKNINNNFDAEAMIFLNGKIHLFTKEWVAKSVTHYEIDPENSENQPAQKIETFKTGFVVTDAALFDKKLYFVGYTKSGEVYLQIFNETESGVFFSGKSAKYFLGNALFIGQIEGIAVDENGIYISGEAFHSPFGVKKQSFYFIPNGKL